ncbi:MAG: NYN domain-containing protein [Chloroflexota bacterium]
MKINVYIDGFNLFYGSLRDSSYRWLNIESLALKLVRRDQLHRVRYFTAKITPRPGHPRAVLHQQVYLRALATLPTVSVHFGHFLTTNAVMPSLYPPPTLVKVIKTEEKGSDVNLATNLLVDAFDGDFEKAIVVSNDSDLCEPIAVMRKKFNLPVEVINPHPSPSLALKRIASFQRQLRTWELASSLLPNTLTDAAGTITKPTGW